MSQASNPTPVHDQTEVEAAQNGVAGFATKQWIEGLAKFGKVEPTIENLEVVDKWIAAINKREAEGTKLRAAFTKKSRETTRVIQSLFAPFMKQLADAKTSGAYIRRQISHLVADAKKKEWLAQKNAATAEVAKLGKNIKELEEKVRVTNDPMVKEEAEKRLHALQTAQIEVKSKESQVVQQEAVATAPDVSAEIQVRRVLKARIVNPAEVPIEFMDVNMARVMKHGHANRKGDALPILSGVEFYLEESYAARKKQENLT